MPKNEDVPPVNANTWKAVLLEASAGEFQPHSVAVAMVTDRLSRSVCSGLVGVFAPTALLQGQPWWWLGPCRGPAVAQAHTPGQGSLVHTHLLSSSPGDVTISGNKDAKDYEKQVLSSDAM